MTIEELREKFHVHTDQIPKLIQVKAFWALAHYLVIFPDICAALEAADGKTNEEKYKSWVKRYLEDEMLSANEYYDIRCKLLHEGNTLGRHRYANYQFTEPDSNQNVVHKCVFNEVIVIDVSEMAKEVQIALEKWFAEIAQDPNSTMSKNVTQNIQQLVQVSNMHATTQGMIVGLNNPVSASR